jgi:hypothetical protein
MGKLNKEDVLNNLEEVKKYIQEAENKKEEVVKGLEIKSRWTGEIKFTSSKTTYKEVCEDNKADLREADLCEADLREADLYGADLREANLYGADLREADLRGASLCEADLREADLREADLRGANLYGADLRGANLYRAELMNAKFTGKGGTTKIRKSGLDNFLKALGIIVEY